MKDGVLMRKYYGEDGSVTHNQVIILSIIIPDIESRCTKDSQGAKPISDEMPNSPKMAMQIFSNLKVLASKDQQC